MSRAADDFPVIRRRLLALRLAELCRRRNLQPGPYLDREVLEAAGFSAEEIAEYRAEGGVFLCPAVAAIDAAGFHVQQRDRR